MDILFLGPPGAGKGTQSQRLAEALVTPWLSTGVVLRRAVAEKTPTGRKAKTFMDAGKYVPDDVLADLVREALARPECRNGTVFDGYPRNDAQAATLEALLAETGRRVDLAVLVDAPEEVVVARLSGRRSCPKDGSVYHIESARPRHAGKCDRCGTPLVQRDDDRPETIVARMTEYRAKSVGLPERYRKAGVLFEVDGTSGSPDAIFNRIREAAAVASRRAAAAKRAAGPPAGAP